jgi:hypothetical protein
LNGANTDMSMAFAAALGGGVARREGVAEVVEGRRGHCVDRRVLLTVQSGSDGLL